MHEDDPLRMSVPRHELSSPTSRRPTEACRRCCVSVVRLNNTKDEFENIFVGVQMLRTYDRLAKRGIKPPEAKGFSSIESEAEARLVRSEAERRNCHSSYSQAKLSIFLAESEYSCNTVVIESGGGHAYTNSPAKSCTKAWRHYAERRSIHDRAKCFDRRPLEHLPTTLLWNAE